MRQSQNKEGPDTAGHRGALGRSCLIVVELIFHVPWIGVRLHDAKQEQTIALDAKKRRRVSPKVTHCNRVRFLHRVLPGTVQVGLDLGSKIFRFGDRLGRHLWL